MRNFFINFINIVRSFVSHLVNKGCLVLVFSLVLTVAMVNAQFSEVHYMPVPINDTAWNVRQPTYYLTTLENTAVNVTVTNPLTGVILATLVVQPNQTTIYQSPYTSDVAGINSFALRFEGELPISVVGNGDPSRTVMSYGWSSKGDAGLGTDFGVYAPSNNFRPLGTYGNYYSVVATVACDVTFTGFPQGNQTVRLQAGEGFMLNAGVSNDETSFFTGRVTATAPIALLNQTIQFLNGGSSTGWWGGSDDGADMVVPVDYLGAEYIVTNTTEDAVLEYVTVIAVEDNTQISVNGVIRGVINSGEGMTLEGADWVGNQLMQISGNNSFYTWHKTRASTSQDGYLLVPPSNNCSNKQNTAVVPVNPIGQVVTATLVTRNGATVTNNGVVIANFTPVGGLDLYKFNISGALTNVIVSTEAMSLTVVGQSGAAATGVSYSGWSKPLTAAIVLNTERDTNGCTIEQLLDIVVNDETGTGDYRYYVSQTQIQDEFDVDLYQSSSSTILTQSGTYFIWVLNNNDGCPQEFNTFFIEHDSFGASINATNPGCANNNGVIEITPNNPAGNYSYYIATAPILDISDSSVYSSSNLEDTLASGTYYIYMLNEDTGCTLSIGQVVLEGPDPIEGVLIIQQNICSNILGIIAVVDPTTGNLGATGGVEETIEYQLFNNGEPVGNRTQNPVFSLLTAGSYTVQLSDSDTCLYSTNAVVLEDTPNISVSLMSDLHCDKDGSFLINAPSGLNNFDITITTPSGSISEVVDVLITGLQEVGEYSIDFRDTATGCDYQINQSLSAPALPTFHLRVTDVLCTGQSTGGIAVQLDETVDAPYQYTIVTASGETSVSSSATFTGLIAGDYTIIVKSAKGCETTEIVTIGQPSVIEIEILQVQHETCLGEQNGSIALEISGGSGAYISGVGDAVNTGTVNSPIFENLSSGLKIITVIDENGCEQNAQVTIATGSTPIATVLVVPVCNNNIATNKVVVQLEAGQDEADFMYALNSKNIEDLGLSSVFENVPPGDHYISISSKSGCLVSDLNFTIIDSLPLSVSLTTTGARNSLITEISGGQKTYQVFINGVPVTNYREHSITESGTYVVRVVDSTGCEQSDSIFATYVEIRVPNFFTPDNDGIHDSWKPENQFSYPEIQTQVKDRYGRTIVVLGYEEVWDGMYQQKPLPTGDYWYVITLNTVEKSDFIGHFSLYR